MFDIFWKTEIQCQSLPDAIANGNKSSSTLSDLLGVAENVIFTAKQYAKILNR